MKDIEDLKNEVINECMQIQEKYIVDDIISIYKDKYKDYKLYLKEKQDLNNRIEQNSQGLPIRIKFICLSELIFNYIKNISRIHNSMKVIQDICECYDPIYKRCNGTRERDECQCNGHTKECSFYPEKRNRK